MDGKNVSDGSCDEETFNMHEKTDHFLNNLDQMWQKGILCDLVLTVDKTIFRVHKVVLSAHSDYFRQMFSNPSTNEQTKVPLLGIKSSVVKQLLRAIYEGNITLTIGNVDDVLTAASYLRIDEIVKLCGRFIERKLSINNCLRTIQVAHMYGLNDILECSYAMACKYFSLITKQEKFKRMRYCEVQSMLHRQDIVADSELEVFNAVLVWLDHDRSSRLSYAGRLMRYVRFPLISQHDLVDKVDGCPSLEGISEINELTREAIRYHLLPYRKSILQNSRTIPRSTYQEELIVCTGGLRDKTDNEVLSHIFCYSQKRRDWLPFTRLPERRHHHAVAVIGGFMYVAGGSSSQNCLDSSDKVWRYDSWSDEWLQVANMHIARQSFALGVLDNHLYAVGGRSNMNDALNNVERYYPGNNKWEEMPPINSPRRHVAVASLNGRLYTVGGSSSDMISRRVERFNLQTGLWEKRHPLMKPRFSASLHAVKNRLWLIGGATVNENDPGRGVTGVFDIESYSVSADQWTLVTKKINYASENPTMSQRLLPPEIEESDRGNLHENGLKEPRAECGSCVLGDNIYLVAGYSWDRRSRLNDVESVDVSQLALRAWTSERLERESVVKFEEDLNISDRLPVKRYPIKCAGVSCCSLVVYKPPHESLSFSSLESPTVKTVKQRPQTVVHPNRDKTSTMDKLMKKNYCIPNKLSEDLNEKIAEMMSLTYPPSATSPLMTSGELLSQQSTSMSQSNDCENIGYQTREENIFLTE